ncbi:MAG: LptF/LptG family permease, partial [bacterium]|nr:LptF/LptG family permease [bacterium]
LLALNRMSSDGEIIAMRAAGLPTRRILIPVLAFALTATSLAATTTLWLTPLSIRETYRVLNQLVAEQLTAEIQPRVFEESFPNTVLFVRDVVAGQAVQWRNVFIADLRPPEQRSGGGREYGDQPRITISTEAIATPDVAGNRIQLSMVGGSTHDAGKEPADYWSSSFPTGEQVLQAKAPAREQAKAFTSMDTGPLFDEAKNSVEARIELHQRLALPFACFLLALI